MAKLFDLPTFFRLNKESAHCWQLRLWSSFSLDKNEFLAQQPERGPPWVLMPLQNSPVRGNHAGPS